MTNKEKLQSLMEQAKELGGQMSEDELNEVVGGNKCVCFLGGGGGSGGNDKACVCVMLGYGESTIKGGKPYRCDCGFSGEGVSTN